MKKRAWVFALAVLLPTLAACGKEETKAPVADKPAMTPAPALPTPPAPVSVPEVEKVPAPAAPAALPPPSESPKVAAPVPAPPVATPAPVTVLYKTKNGDVTFAHQAHGTMLGCPACHGANVPAKIELDMDSAHKLCKGCHQEKGAGPTKCPDCHKK